MFSTISSRRIELPLVVFLRDRETADFVRTGTRVPLGNRRLVGERFRPVEDPQPSPIRLTARHLDAEAFSIAPTRRGKSEITAAERG